MKDIFKVQLIHDRDNMPSTFENWLNENCKMSPIKHMEDKYSQDKPSNMYLSDYLDESTVFGKPLVLDYADSKCPIFISAPTGLGKNYYMEHNILGPLLEKNKEECNNESEHKRILLLSNRVALGRQSKISLAKFIRNRTGESKYYNLLDGIKENRHDLFDEKHDFGDILTYSYQQILFNQLDFTSKNIEYVVFDECHYFTSDSVFNPMTESTLKNLIYTFSHSVRIYMSSTMENVFEPIIRLESDCYQKKRQIEHDHGFQVQGDKRLPVLYYDLSRQYDYLDIKVWKKPEEILKHISKNNGKWLIFVSSKSNGENLKKKISDMLNSEKLKEKNSDNPKKGNPVEFLTADDKDKDVYMNIVGKEKFPEGLQVLITTAVIDNGVNIKDESVTNIVIDVPDRVEFIQMLGRLRVDKKNSNQKITLYIRDYDIKTLFEKWRYDANKLLERIEYEMNGNIPRNEQQQMLEISPESKINNLSLYQLVSRMEDLGRMIKASNPDRLLVLNGSEGDRQIKAFDWIYYNNKRMPLARRICNVLKDIKGDTLKEGTVENDKGKFLYPVLSEKSFLQIIQEKRASSLEHDAIRFIEKMRVDYFEKEKEERLKKISSNDYSWEESMNPSQIDIRIQTVNDTYYPWKLQEAKGKLQEAKEKWYKNNPPDRINDMPWNIGELWNLLKKLQYEAHNFDNQKQELPDAEYMKEKYELYQDLAKNQIKEEDYPVVMEQLHWLDMNVMPEMTDDEPVDNIEEKDNDKISLLLMKYTVPLEDGKNARNDNEKKEWYQWVKDHGMSLEKLEDIEEGKIDSSNENQTDLKYILDFFISFYNNSTLQLLNKIKIA